MNQIFLEKVSVKVSKYHRYLWVCHQWSALARKFTLTVNFWEVCLMMTEKWYFVPYCDSISASKKVMFKQIDYYDHYTICNVGGQWEIHDRKEKSTKLRTEWVLFCQYNLEKQKENNQACYSKSDQSKTPQSCALRQWIGDVSSASEDQRSHIKRSVLLFGYCWWDSSKQCDSAAKIILIKQGRFRIERIAIREGNTRGTSIFHDFVKIRRIRRPTSSICVADRKSKRLQCGFLPQSKSHGGMYVWPLY